MLRGWYAVFLAWRSDRLQRRIARALKRRDYLTAARLVTQAVRLERQYDALMGFPSPSTPDKD